MGATPGAKFANCEIQSSSHFWGVTHDLQLFFFFCKSIFICSMKTAEFDDFFLRFFLRMQKLFKRFFANLATLCAPLLQDTVPDRPHCLLRRGRRRPASRGRTPGAPGVDRSRAEGPGGKRQAGGRRQVPAEGHGADALDGAQPEGLCGVRCALQVRNFLLFLIWTPDFPPSETACWVLFFFSPAGS